MNVKYRIAMWASAGLLVAGCWWLYIFATAPTPLTVEPMLWALARYSCPVVLAGFHFHFGVSVFWVFLANAATYTWIGLIVEYLRRQLNHAE
jgi:hypothetical protein